LGESLLDRPLSLRHTTRTVPQLSRKHWYQPGEVSEPPSGAVHSDGDEEREVGVLLLDLGIGGPARVRDLWSGEDGGTVEKAFGRSLRSHASGLYRLTPVPQ